VVERLNFKRHVVNETVDTVSEQVPAKPDLPNIQVMDVMPRAEAAHLGSQGRLAANSENKINSVEFILVNKIKMPNGNIVVKLPSPEIFSTVIGKANMALIDEDPDFCLALEYAEPDANGIGKLSLNLQVGSGGDRLMQRIRDFSTPEVEYELYPTAPILKKHALTIYLHDGHFVSNARLATTIAKCNPGLKGNFTLTDIKEMRPRVAPGQTLNPDKPLPRILTLDGDEDFLRSLAQFNKNHRFKLANKNFYLNGGVRKDSAPETMESAKALPPLPPSQISEILKAHNERIIAEARRQEEARSRQRK
jgi:hypothetical protein